MKDPVRLLSDPDATPFERGLLESWSHEQPSAKARMNALGIAGVAAAAAGTAAGVGALAPKASTLFGVAALAKWTIVGIALVGGGVATYAALSRAPAREPVSSVLPATPAPLLTASAATAAVATASTPVTDPPILSPADLPTAAAAVAPTGATSAQGSTPIVTNTQRHGAASEHESSLAEEIALFDQARAALDAGDAGGSLALLDAYERRFPNGTFAQEAEVLRVQALVRRGDRAGATRVGQRFLAAHPTSPHAARIRGILSSSER